MIISQLKNFSQKSEEQFKQVGMRAMGQYLRNILKKYAKIVVWGTGNFYTLYKDLLDERFSYFVDNNQEKWSTLFDQKSIFSPGKLKEENSNETLIIICNHYFDEISEQIMQYGDFDIIDIVTIGIVQQKEKEILDVELPGADGSVLVCGGIHAMWQTNGSRKFIDGQIGLLHQAGFHTIEVVPLLYYQSGNRACDYLAVSIDGAYQGLFLASGLAAMYPKVRGMVIHSLYYSHNTMKALLDSISVETRVLYYIHDYSCLCFCRFLYKDKKLCIGADGKLICNACSEDGKRRELLHFHQSVFAKYNLLLIAPSKDTKVRVEAFFPDIEIVELPHLEFEQELFRKQVNSRIRIAYIGTAIWHKGWEQFTRLVDRFYQKYDFYCLGECPDGLKIQNVTYISVGLDNSGNIFTMVKALSQNKIDVAYIGSIWPETYSYTYYEAYEAGCFVLTNSRSGNVYDQVVKNQNGLAFVCEDEMAAWLENDTVEKEIIKTNKKIKNVQNSKAFLKYFE